MPCVSIFANEGVKIVVCVNSHEEVTFKCAVANKKKDVFCCGGRNRLKKRLQLEAAISQGHLESQSDSTEPRGGTRGCGTRGCLLRGAVDIEDNCGDASCEIAAESTAIVPSSAKAMSGASEPTASSWSAA